MARLVALLAAALLASTSAALIEKPQYSALWYSAGQADASDKVEVTVNLKLQNLDVLAQIVEDVSDPKSPNYKEYKTAQEIEDLTAPAPEARDIVVAWLAPAASIVDDSMHRSGVIRATFTVAAASELFKTTFTNVRHPEIQGKKFLVAGDYMIPQEVSEVTTVIMGLHGLPVPSQDAQITSMPPNVTPDVIEKVYKISGVKPSGSMKNVQAVAEFQGQLMSEKDLATFFKMYLPNAPASDAVVNKFYGAPYRSGEGIEALLDIEFIMGVAPGLKTDFYEQLNQDFCSDLKNWTTMLLSQAAMKQVPNVHSISYGWQGNLTQIGCKMDEMTVVDTDFMKLSGMGVSIIFASGDSGSGYAPPHPEPTQCAASPGTKGALSTGSVIRNLTLEAPNDQEAAHICCEIAGEIGASMGYAGWAVTKGSCSGPECRYTCTVLKTITGTKPAKGSTSGKKAPTPPSPPHPKIMLYPSWPASSNYVTAVGATRFEGDVVTNPEAAVNQEDHFGSGGGFSPWTQFPEMKCQKEAVANYFKTVDPSTLPDPTKVSYNKAGRATPDVSALGTGFQVIVGGRPNAVGGTSASAPTFAAIVSLVNEALIAKGMKPMGYLNPFIYQNSQAFTDVTVGSNKIGRGGPILPYGFNCSKGWDPVTGMGTPIFPELLKAAMATGK